MKRMETIVLLMLIAFLGWHSNIVNSAAISQDRPLVPPKIQTNDEKALQLNMQLFREAVGDYAELNHAYNAPAKDELTREKRTLGLIRNIANRTRAGFASVRRLFTGGSSGGGGFRTFFSNLLNRVLIFLTQLWDRITGFFRGDGSSGGGIFGRIGSLFRGGSSGGGGLFSFLRPTTTTESYFPDYDFSYEISSSTTSTTENYLGSIEDAVGGNLINDNEGKSLDDIDDDGTDDFPFPADSDLSARSSKSLDEEVNDSDQQLSQLNKRKTFPAVAKSSDVIHLIDDGRRFGA